MQIQELFTRKRHNEGVKVDIRNDAGEVVGWIRIRGLDSDAYRAAHDGYNRAMVRLAAAVRANPNAVLLPETTEDKKTAEILERAALVLEWSFETTCTPSAVIELLHEAPYISDAIWYAANDRDRFLGNFLPSSSAGQSTNSGLEEPQPKAPSTP
jgi:hypothetical protein